MARITNLLNSLGGRKVFLYRVKKIVIVAGIASLIASCSKTADRSAIRPVTLFPEAIPASANSPDSVKTSIEGDQKTQQPRADYQLGTGSFTNNTQPYQKITIADDGGVSMAFRNTDIRVILQAVLKDTLDIPYIADERVQGSASLETNGSVSRGALRASLEALLKLKGYALLSTNDGYFVLPVSEAPNKASLQNQIIPTSVDLPGFGVHTVALKFTRPSEMRRLLEPLSPAGSVVYSDDPGNILIIAGTSGEIASMMHAVETFDVDRMKGMSFGVYRLNYVEADQILSELEQVFSATGASVTVPVKFIPIPRINKLIAVSPNSQMLQAVEAWIEKLDLGESSPGRRIYVYNVKNGRAADLSQTLNAIMDTQSAVNRGQGGLSGPINRTQSNPRSGNGRDAYTNNLFGENGVRIVPSEENNSLVIMATPSEFAVIENALRQIDLEPQQVLVEVTLADVSLTEELRYGLQWHFEFGDNSVAFGSAGTNGGNQVANTTNGFSWAYNNVSSVNAILSALESMTDVKVISAPKILVLNNQSATLQVGDEVPVPTASAISTNDNNAPIVNSIQYRNTGVILTVTPRISQTGMVMLDVEQEVSNVVETASSGIDAPTIQQRRMTSSVAVQNGSTIALGGLIRSTVSQNNSGVPFLKNIPILGIPFKESGWVERRSELVVLLTPRIIQNAQQTREVMDYIRKEFQSVLGDFTHVSSLDAEAH